MGNGGRTALSIERHDAEPPREEKQAPGVNWDQTFREGKWEYLHSIAETPRYAAVAGYVHKLLRKGNLLDAGCGEGLLVDYLDINRIRYTGFDLSPTAIHRAREQYGALTFLPCSFDDFTPPGRETYDVIVFNEALTSLERPIEILNRFYAFLRPSGHIIISQFQHPDPNSNAMVFTRALGVEIAAGRYLDVTKSEVLNCETGLRWRVYCLGDLRRSGEPSSDSATPERGV
jgi:2-polyprenyl-3-methyl-5-hydroxy-6-metoxy-1,4-benzoquinol methylase